MSPIWRVVVPGGHSVGLGLGLETRLLQGLKCGGVDCPFGYIGERRSGRSLAGVGKLACVRVEELLIGRRGVPIDMGRYLLVEGLLFLLLGGIERHGGGRLHGRNRHGLLWAGLMHRELTLPVLAEGRLLRKRVGLLWSPILGRHDGRSGGHPGTPGRKSYNRPRRVHISTGPRHDGARGGDERVPAHLPCERRPPTHSNTGRIDAATVGTRSSAGEALAEGSKASSAATAKALLIRSLGSWNEDEGSLFGGEDVARCCWGKGDADGLVAAERRAVVRQARVLLDGHIRELYGLLHSGKVHPDLGIGSVHRRGEVAGRRLFRGRRGGAIPLRWCLLCLVRRWVEGCIRPRASLGRRLRLGRLIHERLVEVVLPGGVCSVRGLCPCTAVLLARTRLCLKARYSLRWRKRPSDGRSPHATAGPSSRPKLSEAILAGCGALVVHEEGSAVRYESRICIPLLLVVLVLPPPALYQRLWPACSPLDGRRGLRGWAARLEVQRLVSHGIGRREPIPHQLCGLRGREGSVGASNGRRGCPPLRDVWPGLRCAC